MVAKTISAIVAEAEQKGILQKNGKDSLKWFAQKVRGVRADAFELVSTQPTDRYRNTGNIGIGKMAVFAYDPKLKKKLPYYDTVPCIFIVNIMPEKKAFLGINLHYLPYKARAVLLDELYEIENNSKIPMNKKLKVSWQVLQKFANFNLVKPCIKMYLFNHVRSKLVQIPYQEWSAVAMLPVSGGFAKKSAAQVWNDSMNQGDK